MVQPPFFMSVDRFVTQLRRATPPANCINPWRGRSAAAVMRQTNLSLYLQEMVVQKPHVLLVGEAPGYRGCGLTGVPFTSERILSQGAAGLFGANTAYKINSSGKEPTSEASATIVWQTLNNYSNDLPIIWNAFPFHPHKADNVKSNRPPTIKELQVGAIFLGKLLKLFPSVQTVVAVGNRADECLNRMIIAHQKVRHPSHGGKQEFVAGLDKILKVR
ncbi:MAG: uracil-DNA glycosylase [Chloroflexota bacterium]